jgi:CBS domain-containing protein
MHGHCTDVERAAAWLEREALTAAEVMVRRPKTLPAAASIEEARMALEDDHVHLLLIVHGATLVGTVTRSDLTATRADPDGKALDAATLAGRTIAPTTSVCTAAALMSATSSRRLAVVDDNDRLLGLLCLKRSGRGFCSDGDVSSRRPSRIHPDT